MGKQGITRTYAKDIFRERDTVADNCFEIKTFSVFGKYLVINCMTFYGRKEP